MKNDSDYIVRTAMTRIDFYDSAKETLIALGEILQRLRNDDYVALLEAERTGAKITAKQRRDYLLPNGLNMRYADSIIMSNNDQIALAKRTYEENVKSWEYEKQQVEKKLEDTNITGYKKDQYLKQHETLERKIYQSTVKHPSVCFGGAKLFKQYTQASQRGELSDELEANYHNKRLFLEFVGQSGYIGGNTMLRINPENWEVTLLLTQELMKQLGLESRTVVLGKVDVRNKKYRKNLTYCVENRVSTTCQFVWSMEKQRFRLHISTRINKSSLPPRKAIDKGRTCGIDQNNGFITATIIDRHGNPIAQRNFNHESAKDLMGIIHELQEWCSKHGCFKIAIEDLKSLWKRKRRSASRVRGINRVVNRIPHGEFKRLLENMGEEHGFEIVEVNPYGTSKNTIQWSESKFGLTIHEKASYLIARRASGFSLERKLRHHTRGCGGAGSYKGVMMTVMNDEPMITHCSSDHSPDRLSGHLFAYSGREQALS